METIIVILIVALAVGLLVRGYYIKYKRGGRCSCGCTACPVDTVSCDFPDKRDE